MTDYSKMTNEELNIAAARAAPSLAATAAAPSDYRFEPAKCYDDLALLAEALGITVSGPLSRHDGGVITMTAYDERPNSTAWASDPSAKRAGTIAVLTVWEQKEQAT
ncbi:MAG: hypothetical protein GF393_10770 [Armatimonadia bacterium]|nr:hypothetical protein [Armatimonadia bacterium]